MDMCRSVAHASGSPPQDHARMNSEGDQVLSGQVFKYNVQ